MKCKDPKKTNLMFLIIAVALLFSFHRTEASSQAFSTEYGTVELNVPAGWHVAKDLFGMPLAVLGPEKQGYRPVISINFTPVKNVFLKPEELKQGQALYNQGRERWLRERSGRTIAYEPYRHEKWQSGAQAHIAGHRYEMFDAKFLSRQYYVTCKNKLYYLALLLRENHEESFGKSAEEIVKSFGCK